jgi:hypothetical protein
MTRNAFFLVLLLTAPAIVFSQERTIRGTVTDSSEKKNLQNSVIAVLRSTDSVLTGFTRSDPSGNFVVKNLAEGNFLLMISHPAYADYVEKVNLAGNAGIDLGKIFMTLKSQLLQEVIISGTGAIRIKGDTTEYKADSFYMKEGATVEDLLKKLPGIQVDKNGKITAQGETVQKVLVDGEEFFSDDPTIVTKNMLSDAIDKVQVYDKKSDQAAFTGIDDGQKSKTIDLKLKADRKKGYFGKLELGTDGNKYWNNSGMLNAFKGKRKFSAFGIMSNTGKTGLDWNENMNYGYNSGGDMGFEDGGVSFSFNNSGDDLDRGGNFGQGLPRGWNGGLLYSNKWNDKISLNSSFQYKKINTDARGSIQSKYILPDTLYYVNENGNTSSSKYRNSLFGTYEYQIDSGSTLKITAQGYTGRSENVNNSYSESLDKDGRPVNKSNRQITSGIDNSYLNTTLLYRKKFKKPGRTFSLNMSQSYNDSRSDGLLHADYSFYDDNELVKEQQFTDQQKINKNTRSSNSARGVYTEPLSKLSILKFNYSINNNHGKSSITTLEKINPSNPKYEEVIDSLSNNYSLNVLTNSAGISYAYSKPKKISLSFGGDISKADFSRNDIRADTLVKYNFVNLFPRANVNLTLPGSGNLSFNYSGNTRAPSIDQIQPVKDNSDELNQRIGNPDLKQSFRQRFTLTYNSFKLLSERSLYANINFNTVQNDFSTINYIDALGRRISQPVNVQGNYSLGAYGYYSKKIKKTDLRLGLNADINKSHQVNFINTLKNVNNTFYIGISPRISFNKTQKIDINLGPRLNWTRTTSSIRPDEPTQYWTQEHYIDISVFLPWKMELNSDCTFSLREKTDAFDRNTNAIRWNARLDKKFLKNGAAVLRLSAFDILDQNIGFQRNVNSNFISERTYDTFRRYFMLTVIYNFNKNGKPQ